MLPPVLILVLVDVGLGPLRVVVAEAHDRLVLILVLVDVGLGPLPRYFTSAMPALS